jgi:hypothetical protein
LSSLPLGALPTDALSSLPLGALPTGALSSLPLGALPTGALSSLPLGALPVGGLSGLPMDGQAGAIQQLQALTQTLGLPGQVLSELPNTDTVTNTAAAATAIASDLGAGFTPSSDLSHGLDSSLVSQDLGVVNTVTSAAGVHNAGDLTGHLTGAVGSAVSGDVTGALGSAVSGNLTSGLGHGVDLTSGLGGVGANVTGAVGDLTNSLHAATGVDAGHVVTGVTGHLGGEVEHNNVGNVTGHVGDIAEHAGTVTGAVTPEVHDLVSSASQIGIGEIGHVEVGNVLSGNDVHITH